MSRPNAPKESPIWLIFRLLAPVIIAFGVVAVVVGIATGQSTGIILVNLMTLVLGVILLLTVRVRRR